MIHNWTQSIAGLTYITPPRSVRLGVEKKLVDKLPVVPQPREFPIRVSRFAAYFRSATKPSNGGYTDVDANAFFYTHEEFAKAIYLNLQLQPMKTKIAGCPPQTSYSDGTPRPYGTMFRDSTTVNISEPDARLAKQMTLEFKHNFAHANNGKGIAKAVFWWIQFCGSIFHYGAYLAQLRADTGNGRLVRELASRHVLVSNFCADN